MDEPGPSNAGDQPNDALPNDTLSIRIDTSGVSDPLYLQDDDILEALAVTSDYIDDSDEDPSWVPFEKDQAFKLPVPRTPFSFEELSDEEFNGFSDGEVEEKLPPEVVEDLDGSELQTQQKNKKKKNPRSKREQPPMKKKKREQKKKKEIDPNKTFSKRKFPTPEPRTQGFTCIASKIKNKTNNANPTLLLLQDANQLDGAELHDHPYVNRGGPIQIKEPHEYFREYFDDEFYEQLALNTGCYYMATKGLDLKTSARELKNFIGINLYMGCIRYPRIHMYWQRKVTIPVISESMTRDRFYLLRNNIHIVDANTVSAEDKAKNRLWKIQPIVDLVRNKCLTIPRDHIKTYSMDEQMVPFTGRCPVRQYVKNKPRPVGLKNFVLTTNDGLVLDFEIYQGKTTRLCNPELGLGPSAIMRLAETLPPGSQIFFDRYFTSIPLFDALLAKGLYGTGTIMRNRLPKDALDLSAISKLKRGQHVEFTRRDDKVCVVAWMDSGPVLMASSYYGSSPESIVTRWDLKTKTEIEVTCPAVVKQYNSCMGGVDICDQMLEYYRTFFKTTKWTVKAIIHFIDLAVVNSWLTYRIACKANKRKRAEIMDLLEFRMALAESLTSLKPKRASVRLNVDQEECEETVDEQAARKRYMPIPNNEKRLDGYNHFPIMPKEKNASRCRLQNCTAKTRVFCEKCRVYLCLTTDRSCFKDFHTKK